jgi:hypothetical protein
MDVRWSSGGQHGALPMITRAVENLINLMDDPVAPVPPGRLRQEHVARALSVAPRTVDYWLGRVRDPDPEADYPGWPGLNVRAVCGLAELLLRQRRARRAAPPEPF